MDHSIYQLFREQYEDNWYFAARADVLTAVIAPLCPAGRAFSIADVGGGTGSLLARVRQHGRAVAIEGDLQLAQVGRQLYGIPFVQGDLSHGVPLNDDTLDIVLMLDVLEHVEDERALLSEVARVLRPHGRLVVSVPAFQALWSRHDELHHHKRRYSRRSLVDVLTAAGFACERVTYFNTLLFPLVYGSRSLERFSSRWRGSTTDYERGPRIMTAVLRWLFSLERRIIPRWNLPVGVSLLVLARRT